MCWVDAQLCQSILWIISRVRPYLCALNSLQRNLTFVLSNICHHQILGYGHVQLDPMKTIVKGFDMSQKHGSCHYAHENTSYNR